MELYRSHVLVCGGTGCSSSGSAKLIERFEEQLKEKGLDKEVKVVRTGCFGLCEAGPVVIVYPEGTFYSRVKVEDVDEIVSEHLLKGRKVQHLVYVDHKTHESSVQKSLNDIFMVCLFMENSNHVDWNNVIPLLVTKDGWCDLIYTHTQWIRHPAMHQG